MRRLCALQHPQHSPGGTIRTPVRIARGGGGPPPQRYHLPAISILGVDADSDILRLYAMFRGTVKQFILPC